MPPVEKIVLGTCEKPEQIVSEYETNLQPEAVGLEKIKDELFDSYMLQQLTEDFFESLAEYLDEEAVDEVRGVLSMYDDKDIYATLSLPAELRDRKFTEFQQKIEAGADIKDIVDGFVGVSKKYGFGVGYHTSPAEIKPDQNGRWSIKGTEADHRDGDRAMAYYSRKYRHLFKKKDPRFVYIVRSEDDTHKTDGNWSRASELSIVAVVPFTDVFRFVEDTAKEIVEHKKGAQSQS